MTLEDDVSFDALHGVAQKLANAEILNEIADAMRVFVLTVSLELNQGI